MMQQKTRTSRGVIAAAATVLRAARHGRDRLGQGDHARRAARARPAGARRCSSISLPDHTGQRLAICLPATSCGWRVPLRHALGDGRAVLPAAGEFHRGDPAHRLRGGTLILLIFGVMLTSNRPGRGLTSSAASSSRLRSSAASWRRPADGGRGRGLATESAAEGPTVRLSAPPCSARTWSPSRRSASLARGHDRRGPAGPQE